MTQEIIEGNKLIAEFMGWKHGLAGGVTSFYTASNGRRYLDDLLVFHSSWDWQIPAYSQFIFAYEGFATNNSPEIKSKFMEFFANYSQQVCLNKPLKAFNILIEAMKLYNSLTSSSGR